MTSNFELVLDFNLLRRSIPIAYNQIYNQSSIQRNLNKIQTMSELEICRFAFEGKYDKLTEKIDSDISYLTKKDGSGRIALHWAASGCQKNVVNYLLQKGSPVDEPDDTNWTPLMIATSVGCADIVSTLISRGADVNAINQTGQTALHYAASKNRDEIVRILLANHANINAADNMGSTPLHRAASKGNIKIMKIFLEEYSNQLDLSPKDCVGNSPLHLACEEERMEAAKLLIEAGASTDTLNKEKKSPFEMAPPQIRSTLRKMADAVLYP